MFKVLILAYDYPPYVSVAGLRPHAWAKYLNDFDIYPIIVTRNWETEHSYDEELEYISPSKEKVSIVEEYEKYTLIKTPYFQSYSNRLKTKKSEFFLHKFITRIFVVLENILQFYSLTIGSKKQLYFEADKYLKTNKVDCIIATGDPFILFSYASKLSKNHDIPWIADYRDPWSNDYGLRNKPFQKWWSKKLEKRIVKTAKGVSAVPEFLPLLIIPQTTPRLELPNGFDPEINIKDAQIPQSKLPLKIGFAGTIKDWDPIEKVFSQTQKLLKSCGKQVIELNFYGTNKNDQLILLKQKYKLSDGNVNIFPRLNNVLLNEKLKQQHALLLFNYYSQIGTKIYDYLAIQRPILFCFTKDQDVESVRADHFKNLSIPVQNNLQEQVIQSTNAGILLKNENELYSKLEALVKQLEFNQEIKIKSNNIDHYSRYTQTAHLAKFITQITRN